MSEQEVPLAQAEHHAPRHHAGSGPVSHERLADRLADFLARVSADGVLRFVAPNGCLPPELAASRLNKGANLLDGVVPVDHARLRAALQAAAQEGQRQALCVRLARPTGQACWVACRILPMLTRGQHVELLFAAWDIAAYPAHDLSGAPDVTLDGLTGLPNRAGLMQHLREAIAQAIRSDQEFTLLHLGLDGFKKVNDALGHAVGDRLLVETGARLKTLLRGGDTVARTSGDEFALLLPGRHSPDDVHKVARKLLSDMQRPFSHGKGHLHLSASIGIARFPEHAQAAEQVFKCADIALAMAKRAGRNRSHLYQPEGGAQRERRFLLEEAMYDAVQNGEFEMHYQPIFRADTREMVGVEALMRWARPGGGFVSPAEFIPLAEANGLINFLGAWSLRASCHQVASWNEAWHARLWASVNVSPMQFRQGDIIATVEAALHESALPADLLALELTEGVLMQDPEHAQAILARLRERGVCFAVDDFGTGYSSLAYLKRFPLASLKIDRSFVIDLASNANDHAIVSAILSLARELGLRVIAEGVEDEAQLGLLVGKGCEYVQGYLLGQPLPPERFADRVKAGEWRIAS